MKTMNDIKHWADFLRLLSYSKSAAKKSETLWIEAGKPGSLSSFRRKIRILSHEARLQGHWIVADDNGYYLAVNKKEWEAYKRRRLNSIVDEMEAIANCDRVAIGDLVKNIFAIKLNNPNYELF
ncbi:MAG: hypothetical protein U5K00_02240 [Melioribacteraceae bacterium]|nr:hypothetical protein [Melioribacteraceae bacterium]